MKLPVVYIVVPCYNEEQLIRDTAYRLRDFLNEQITFNIISNESRVLFIDDGSKDRTWDIIISLHKEDAVFEGIKLAHNRGHQNALYAGLMEARKHCDVSISIDADLQDDIAVMGEMIDKSKKGSNIVFGIREDRSSDSYFKRNSAVAYYKLLNGMGVQTIPQHADFRLMDKTAMEALSEYEETNLFLRGIVTDIGLNTDTVKYSRKPRTAGESKYTIKKMLELAEDGITSFSTAPLRWPIGLGLASNGIGVTMMVYALRSKSVMYRTMAWFWTMQGIQFLMIGIVGEYVGKIYIESKKRPRYFLESSTLY